MKNKFPKTNELYRLYSITSTKIRIVFSVLEIFEEICYDFHGTSINYVQGANLGFLPFTSSWTFRL